MYGGDGTSTRALANEEEKRMKEAVARRKGRGGDGDHDEAMPLTEVVKNRRHNKCVPLSARLARATKQTTLSTGGAGTQRQYDKRSTGA